MDDKEFKFCSQATGLVLIHWGCIFLLKPRSSDTAKGLNSFFTHYYCNINIILLIESVNAMVLVPCDTCSAETEIKANIRKGLVGLMLIKVPAKEIWV